MIFTKVSKKVIFFTRQFLILKTIYIILLNFFIMILKFNSVITVAVEKHLRDLRFDFQN